MAETSLEAYRGLNPSRLRDVYRKIVEALSVIGKGNYEAIAKQAEEKESRIWKRLKEVRELGLIHNTGEMVKTKDGRNSYVFALGPDVKSPKKKERIMKGKIVADYSRAIKKVSIPIPEVKQLF